MNNEYINVSELSKYIKSNFDNDAFLRKVYLKGEISNFKNHTTGHFYFSLKDEGSRINAVMFRDSARSVKFTPCDGMKVLVTGRVSVYEQTGSYQIYVDNMIEDGIGNLYVKFEELKKKLSEEGLFDKSRKRRIVRIPKKIGIVTAPTGAAIRDILTTIKRRYPLVETILFPALVQGDNAALDIAKKIKIANTYDIDTLIVGRGGGSIEDLWPFNEEVVARAIYNSRVPVISAVGHEIDFTISDFVADLRAATPTAAAELSVVDINTIITYLDNVRSRSYTSITNIIEKNNALLVKLKSSYVLTKPSNMYEIKIQNLDNIIDKLNNEIKFIIEKNSARLSKIKGNYILNNPSSLYKYQKQHMDNIINKLEVLNPMNTLKRGYSIVKKDDKVVSKKSMVKKEDIVNINLSDGVIVSKVMEVK